MAKTGKESDEKEAKERKRKSLPQGFATLYETRWYGEWFRWWIGGLVSCSRDKYTPLPVVKLTGDIQHCQHHSLKPNCNYWGADDIDAWGH